MKTRTKVLLLCLAAVAASGPIISRLRDLRDVRLAPSVTTGNALIWNGTVWTNGSASVDATNSTVYNNGSLVSNPNFLTDTNIIFLTRNASNIVGVITNIDGSKINTGTVSTNRLDAAVSLFGGAVTEAEITLADVATLNATLGAHGFMPKGTGNTNAFYNGSNVLSTVSINAFNTNGFTLNQIIKMGASGFVAAADDGGAGGSPGGSDTQVQYNNAGAFAGASGVTITAETNLSVSGTFTVGTSGVGGWDFGTSGMRVTGNAGIMTWLSLGPGADENLLWDGDTVANTFQVTSSTGVGTVVFSMGLTATVFTGPLSGNADTATLASTVAVAATTDTTSSFAVLETATGNQAVKSAAGATLNANTGAASFTSIAGDGSGLTGLDAGDISAGTLSVARGGQGNATLSAGAVLVGNGTSPVNGVTSSSTTDFLRANGAGQPPVYSAIDLASASVTGVLPVANGGNGAILRSFDIPMGAWMTNGLAVPATLASWTNVSDSYLFPDTTTNGIYFRTSLPTNWNAGTISLMFKTGSTTTNNTSNTNAVWGARATSVQGGQEDVQTWGTEVTGTNHIHKSPYFSGFVVMPPLTVGNTPAANKDMVIQLRRIPTDATDVNTNTLAMLNVTLFYIENATKQTALPLATN